MPSFDPIDLDEFQDRTGIIKTGLVPEWDKASRIVALRDIVSVESSQDMPVPYLQKLIANIGLAGDPKEKPYKDCDLQLLRLDPNSALVAQTFVERKKYNSILENVSELFGKFATTRGIAKLTARIVLGRDEPGDLCIAHYLPPLVEAHTGRVLLLDGTHRSFLVKSIGTTVEAIMIRGVTAPFPCEPQEWADVSKVDVKPPKHERFIGLKPDYFRDVKYIGIDG